MSKTFRVDIVTPDRAVYGGAVESLRVPAEEGDLGVLAGHAPLLCLLRPGLVRLRAGGALTLFAVGGGYLDVSGGRALILADSAEAPQAIDRKRAEEAVERARERLLQRGKDVDVQRAELALARALNRLKAAERPDGSGDA
jgi:F-type H+-transporting ATPase subunit epsilon